MGNHKSNLLVVLLILAICTISSMAQLQSPPLQDFCSADLNTTLVINGRPCKDPSKVEDDDFFTEGQFQGTSVGTMPGLNTLGIKAVVLSFGPSGINAPHYHPRASELVYVLEGTLQAGFVTTGPEHRLFTKVLNKGDVFIVPFGMVHFQSNVGKGNVTAKALVFFNGDNQGFVDMQFSVFFTQPKIPVDVLAKSYRVDQNIIKQLVSAPSN